MIIKKVIINELVKMSEFYSDEPWYDKDAIFMIKSDLKTRHDHYLDLDVEFTDKCEIFGHTRTNKLVPIEWFRYLKEEEKTFDIPI